MDNGSKSNEIQVGVSFSSFMTAVSTFFAGILLSRYDTFDSSIKVPIIFLIICTFAFLYSSMIYANASGNLARFAGKKFKQHMEAGNVVLEYLGTYLLVLAFPLVIASITKDLYFEVTTLSSAIIGLFLYSVSKLSIIHRHTTKSIKYLFTIAIILFEIYLYLSQKGFVPYFLEIAIVLLIFMLISSYYFYKQGEK